MNVRFIGRDRTCVLFEPFCRQPYVIEDKTNRDDKTKAIKHRSFGCASACASRSGWVLFSEKVDVNLSGVLESIKENQKKKRKFIILLSFGLVKSSGFRPFDPSSI